MSSEALAAEVAAEAKRIKEIWAICQQPHPKIKDRYITDYYKVCAFRTDTHATLVEKAVTEFDNAFKVRVMTPREQEVVLEYNEVYSFCDAHPEFVLPAE